MTEHDWLVSTDPAAMYRELVGHSGMSDKEHSQAAQAACRAMLWEAGGADLTSNPLDDENMVGGWFLNTDEFSCEVPAALQCDIIRCIWGNPWVVVERIHAQCTSRDRNAPTGGRYLKVHDDWLTWHDGTIPNLARAAVESRRRKTCPGHRCDPVNALPSYPNNDGPETCGLCHGTRLVESTTLDPHAVAIVADALEEAGCTDVGLLGHLRSQEKCGRCKGKGFWTEPGRFIGKGRRHVTCPDCDDRPPSSELRPIHCGTGTRTISHWPGCWALTLFTSALPALALPR